MSDTPDEIEALAGEYVMGLLNADETEAFERRIASDPDVRRATGRWRARLLPLDEAAPSIAPSAELWNRIETRIGRAGAVESVPQAEPGWFTKLFGRTSPMRMTLVAASLALVMFVAGALFSRGLFAPDAPIAVAVLTVPNETRAAAVVEAFADGRVRVVPLVAVDVPAGRTLQVWTLWDRQVGPRSVGLMERPAERLYQTSGFPRPQRDQLFELTLEPAGGSPTGRPTGPVVFIGRATERL